LGNYNLTGMKRNITAGEGITDDKVGLPMGYVMKGWQMPQKPGQISARAYDLAITATATGILGMPGEGSATFSITTNNPAGELIVSGAGSATLEIATNTPQLTASINGTGSATFAVTTNTPILGAIADLIAEASFAITGSLTSHAIGHMVGNALPYTELSPQSLASAVWSSLLAEYQDAGMAGKALSTTASGGVDLVSMAQAVLDAAALSPIHADVKSGQADIADAVWNKTLP
jgi:hypothetical protein